jgi:transcriptional regulator with XRE-family HTH domain
MTELLESIGHNIRRLRDEKGWNQTELGFRADTSPSIISLIENGKRNPSTATLAKIAEALGVEVVDLFPKGRRSSPEPSLFNGDDERTPTILARGVADAADKWHATVSNPNATPYELNAAVDAALGLGEALVEQFPESSTVEFSPENSEAVSLAGRLIGISEIGNERVLNGGQEEPYRARREQIRELTRRISA